jgi:hypothetical protein
VGGIFIVSEDSTIGMAGWAFDNVTRLLKSEIDGVAGERVIKDIDLAELSGLAMLNLTEYTPGEMQELARALVQVERALRAAGPESFADPKFFPGFMNVFGELLTSVHNDPRATLPLDCPDDREE